MACPPKIVDLNVGGVHFTTSLDTLLGRAVEPAGTMLSAMFSGGLPTQKDEGGRYFIDRDGGRFGAVLNYLRGNSLGSGADLADIREEAHFFRLERLCQVLDEEIARREMEEVLESMGSPGSQGSQESQGSQGSSAWAGHDGGLDAWTGVREGPEEEREVVIKPQDETVDYSLTFNEEF